MRPLLWATLAAILLSPAALVLVMAATDTTCPLVYFCR